MTLRRLDSPAGFDHFTDWAECPGSPRLPTGWHYVAPTNVYDYGDLKITVSIDRGVWLSCCKAGFFNGDFAQNANVLLGDNIGANLPIHLLFDPPVARVGTYVSADTTAGLEYLRQLGVKPAGGPGWDVVTATGLVSKGRGTATFLGAEYDDGTEIEEIYIDVVNVPGQSVDIRQVAIGDLYYSMPQP